MNLALNVTVCVVIVVLAAGAAYFLSDFLLK